MTRALGSGWSKRKVAKVCWCLETREMKLDSGYETPIVEMRPWYFDDQSGEVKGLQVIFEGFGVIYLEFCVI